MLEYIFLKLTVKGFQNSTMPKKNRLDKFSEPITILLYSTTLPRLTYFNTHILIYPMHMIDFVWQIKHTLENKSLNLVM